MPPPKAKAAVPAYGRFKTTAIVVAVFSLIYGLYAYLDSIVTRFYIFEPSHLHQLAQHALSLHPDPSAESLERAIDHIVKSLTEEYGTKHINVNQKEWFFSNAGGAMGAMYIIHASVTEYLIIFGTPLGTEGHTGRHTADDYFHILQGEQWAFKAGDLEKEVYAPGSVHHLPRGTVKQYKMHEGCFALEYARGWIPLMMPFGLADVFTSTLDFPTLWETVAITGREIVRNLLVGKL